MIPYFALLISIANMFFVQLLKLPIQYLIDKKWTPSIIFSTGGMPSSHSALVTSLTIAIALTEGVASPYFAISFVFASVIIHDAIGIRREAGKHATVLNKMKTEIQEIVSYIQSGTEEDKTKIEKNLRELLGHEPLEAVMGVLIGAATTVIAYFILINL